jgi:cobalt-zinc-cadmium efflux system protein
VSRTQRLATVLLLSLGLVTALVIVGLAAHSIAVLAAGADYLADAIAIGASLAVVRLAARPPSYQDATTVAALFSAGWLLMLNIGIAVVAIQHLATGTHRVEGFPVLVVSVIAGAVTLAGALVLGGADDDDGKEALSVRAVLLAPAADAAAAAGVAVSGAIILGADGWYWLDPATALIIVAVIDHHSLKLIRKITAAPRFP